METVSWMDTTRHVGNVWTRAASRAFAVFLVLHGIVHTIGTTAHVDEAARGRSVEYLGGLWSISDPTVLRAVGVLWAVVAAAYLVPAFAYWVGAPWRRAALAAVTVPSLALAVSALWASGAGVAIDIALLGLARSGRDRRTERVRPLPEVPEARRAA